MKKIFICLLLALTLTGCKNPEAKDPNILTEKEQMRKDCIASSNDKQVCTVNKITDTCNCKERKP